MKTTLFRSIVCASLIVFAVGCGKDNKSSGGGNGYIGGNNLHYDPNHLDQTSQQVIQELNNWYNGNAEGSRGTGIVDIQQIQYSQSSNQTCKSLDWNFITIPYCYGSSSGSSNNGTVISEKKQVNLVRDNGTINSRNNAELRSIFNGSVGEIVQAVNLGNNVIRISLLKNNIVTTYTVDKNYHSLLNPVEKTVTGAQGPSTIYTDAFCSFSVGCTL